MGLDVYLEGIPKEPILLYSGGVTHNLTRMAQEAGLYYALWRPDEHGYTHAHQLVPILTEGLRLLKNEPNRFSTFNPTNGWGDYDGFVEFVEKYLIACTSYPDATVRVWR